MINTLDHLVLSENETLIRAYEASALKTPKATGYLVATNCRLTFLSYPRVNTLWDPAVRKVGEYRVFRLKDLKWS